MRHTLKLPKLGDTVDEVVVLEWLVSEGATILVGDPLLRVETDKVEVEVPTPIAGRLVQALVQAGSDVGTGQPIAVLES